MIEGQSVLFGFAAHSLIREIGSRGGMVYLSVRNDDAFRRVWRSRCSSASWTPTASSGASATSDFPQHPFITTLLDGNTTPDGHPFFAMEYVEGQRIVNYCESKGLAVRTLESAARSSRESGRTWRRPASQLCKARSVLIESDARAFAAPGSNGPSAADGFEMTHKEIQEFFATQQEHWRARDAQKLAQGHAEHGTIISPIFRTVTGAAAILASYRTLFEIFPDWDYHGERLLIDGSSVAEPFSVTATHVGEFMGLQGTGRRFELQGVRLYDMKDGLILFERRYYDFTGLLIQLGVLRSKPAC